MRLRTRLAASGVPNGTLTPTRNLVPDRPFISLGELVGRHRLSDKPLTAVPHDAGSGYALAPSLAVGTDVAVTASADGQLVTWPLKAEEWIAEGCAVHRRELTDAEKSRYGLQGASPICGS